LKYVLDGTLVAEWNIETALEVHEEEGFEQGVEIGEKRGVAMGHKATLEMIDKGYTGLIPQCVALDEKWTWETPKVNFSRPSMLPSSNFC